jgi:protein-S-isoprenylcysteine O-methyltransferase Ste14
MKSYKGLNRDYWLFWVASSLGMGASNILQYVLSLNVLDLTGSAVWVTGALRSDMDEHIAENRLKTDGIYAWVRNPMYSGCWMMITGASLQWHNVWLIPVCIFNWLLMTLVLNHTEEKWLLKLYGQEYTEYMKRVNRCIPWKRRATE